MKKFFIMIIIFILSVVICTGCSAEKLEYDMNLGYNFNSVDYKNIVYNVYHSNTENHHWEKIASFSCQPEQGHYNDVKLICGKNKISIELWNNTREVLEDGNAVTYDGTALEKKEFNVDGYKGSQNGVFVFAVENKEGEQPVRLYPISNSEIISFFGDLENDFDINEPYDTEEVNLDNILITVTMN